MKNKNKIIILLSMIMILMFSINVQAGRVSAIVMTNDGDCLVGYDCMISENTLIDGDMYICKDATYKSYGNLTVNGNVYVIGNLYNYGTICVNGHVICMNYYELFGEGFKFERIVNGISCYYDWGNFYNLNNIYGTIKPSDEYAFYEIPDSVFDYCNVNGHTNGDAATCVLDGKCLYCDYVIEEAKGHKWGASSIVSKATITKPKILERACSVCGETERIESGKKLTPFIESNASSLKIKKGKTTSDFVISFANGDSVKSWKSSNKKIFTITGESDGTCTIKALKKGTAKITVTLKSGKRKSYNVSVVESDVKTTGIENVPSKKTLKKGKTLQLKANIVPFTSTEKITYKSSDKSIAEVSSKGKITAKKVGKAVITVKSGSVSKKCTITVPGIKIKDTKITLKKGKTTTLKPEVFGSSEKIKYSTSNSKIAYVNSKGKITAKKAGTATITIKCGSYKTTVKITVK